MVVAPRLSTRPVPLAQMICDATLSYAIKLSATVPHAARRAKKRRRHRPENSAQPSRQSARSSFSTLPARVLVLASARLVAPSGIGFLPP